MKKLVFLFLCVCVFTFNAQAGALGCLKALTKPPEPKLSQFHADELSLAIVAGDTQKIEELAKPWLNKDHNYYFTNHELKVTADHLLLFTALVALHRNTTGDRAIKSLETLIEMGFNFHDIGYPDYVDNYADKKQQSPLMKLAMLMSHIELGLVNLPDTFYSEENFDEIKPITRQTMRQTSLSKLAGLIAIGLYEGTNLEKTKQILPILLDAGLTIPSEDILALQMITNAID